MKIEVNKRGTKEYYDEFLYILSNIRKIKKRPQKKVHNLTIVLKAYGIFLLVSIILLIILYYKSFDIIFIFSSGMLTLLLIYTIFYLCFVTKRINHFQERKTKIVINLTKEGITFIDDTKNIKIKWSEIDIILVNKYSISFIPKDISNIFISISTEYKDLVLKGTNKYNYNSLIIDNSNLYK